VLSPGDRLARLRANVDIEAARVEVEGQVAKAQVGVDAARQKVERAQELRERNAGSERALDDARAEFDTAQVTLDAAKRRLVFLGEINVEPDLSSVPSLAVSSPIEGVLQQFYVATDQLVTAGTPLFTVTNLDRMWIRVPVYVGEANSITTNTAVVTLPGEVATKMPRTAARIPAPATANVSASTVDLYFDLGNEAADLRPGQRVMVILPVSKEETRLCVPWSSVVFDIHGGAWVYETTQPQLFTRRRVELERVDGDWAILRRGIKAGSQVVVAGAAELYGTEFGVGK
jgi:RND family efflux transporter MFP subunit